MAIVTLVGYPFPREHEAEAGAQGGRYFHHFSHPYHMTFSVTLVFSVQECKWWCLAFRTDSASASIKLAS